ncbi:hypothetical protein JM946_26650 [Steroidobacter sp. S1-65]|uniref:Transporter n=1 Tax=Steroidobacter gossypii TaxID=2805490 RepID=A0ABS1X539_9GAMM|nr:hypothetical protein [Steroidobacter gossypii]MBM0108327.1 hypothetical protein [Steroidobacter gossypii]
MNIASVRLVHTAAMIAGLAAASGLRAEPNRAEELEQLRINTGYIIEAGEFEVNIVPSHFDYADQRQQDVEAELEYAITDRLMVEIEVPYRWLSLDGPDQDSDGARNIELGAKWLMAEGESHAASIGVGVALPAGHDRPDIASDLWGVDVSIPLTYRFPNQPMSLHVEFGAEWREQQGLEEQMINVAVERRPEGSNVTVQLGSNFIREDGDLEAYLIPAFEIAATPVPFQFGLGVAAGLTSDSADWGLLMDFEVEF